ncbi:MAG: Na+/H+ antiporter NhaA [Minwuiales bacterium]|nr:Na+/H+ antiporter NhaA [Minwuiales bacterium]
MGSRITALGRRTLVLLHHDAAPGVLLMMAAAVALLLDNSPLAWLYDAILSTPVAVQIGALSIDKPLLLWINDGLMAVFFFLVGLEIKRELLDGRLSSWNQAALPAAAAVGGMVMPALIYVAFNYDDPTALNGWAIPAATDIAFTLGVLALLGSRVPTALKVFLLALAIIDDLGAIIIIAIFYTADLSLASLAIAAICTAVLMGLNFAGVRRIAPYILVGIIMWVCVLKSGVHATLAGVVIALTVPLRVPLGAEESPLHKLEHGLHPWVAFFVMPAFAFANAGVHLGGLSPADLLAPIPLGIALGLFAGKQVGVLGFTWVATRVGICRLPEGVSWVQIYGAALLAGIGFTMSLFIGALAFSDPEHASAVRIGVLTGSTLSAVVGYAVLRLSFRPASNVPEEAPRFAKTPI